VPIVFKPDSVNLLELLGPFLACNGIALPLPLVMLKHFNGASTAAINQKYKLEMRQNSFRPLSFFNPQT
jgi:hypothetical protein